MHGCRCYHDHAQKAPGGDRSGDQRPRGQDENPPWTFRHIHLEYVVRGRGLSEKGLAQAIKLSEEKYCSVRNTLSCEVTGIYRIVEEE